MSRGSYRGRSAIFAIYERFVDSLKPKNLKSTAKHIGSDYLGNDYFERQSKELYDRRKAPKRWFVPPNEDTWDRPLPPEWNAWLRLSRTDPPTDQEIEHNLSIQRQKQLFDEQNKASKEETKATETNPYSSFPTYPEYQDPNRSLK